MKFHLRDMKCFAWNCALRNEIKFANTCAKHVSYFAGIFRSFAISLAKLLHYSLLPVTSKSTNRATLFCEEWKSEEWKSKIDKSLTRFVDFGLGEKTWTSGLMNPIHARYQTALHPDTCYIIINLRGKLNKNQP